MNERPCKLCHGSGWVDHFVRYGEAHPMRGSPLTRPPNLLGLLSKARGEREGMNKRSNHVVNTILILRVR
jgi:hypothetical protein